MRLTGKFALITGSSRGIGKGIALKLSQEGATVAVHYLRNRDAAQATLAQIRAAGGDGVVVQADVTDPDAVAQLVERVKGDFGALDFFVANARPEASQFFAPPPAISLEQWNTALVSQATAFLVGARAAARVLRNGGRILAMTYAAGSVTGGLQPWVGMGSAKAALESLVRYFAVTVAPRGITVNAVSPGWTEDSVLNSLPDEVQSLIRRWHESGWTPMRRLGTPADIGNVVSLLCSEEAGWITGQTIRADGGSSLMNAEVPPEIQLG